ncbi:MAG TPA: AMP-binding protein, partial [Solirubrobacterales bacterium]|nr:AMP-binding protein [Solirubrobacterales bacterium]
MPESSSIAARARQALADKAFEVRVLRESGILAPQRPDKTAKVLAAFLRWGASPALGITTAAIKHPHEPALIDERGSLSFEQVHRRSNALAHAFERMGIGPGDGVGIMCRNHRGFVEATLATAKLGASALYLNTMFAGPQLVEVMRREAPKALVHDEEFTELLGDVDAGIERIVAWADGEPEAPTLDALIAANDESNLKPPPDKPRFVILTSGTTGTPKGAQRSSPDGLLSIAALIDKIPFRSREKMMVAAPLFHSWGFFHFIMSLPTASTLVLRRRFDPEETLRAVQEHRTEVLAAVPVMIQRILQLPDETLASYDLSSLRITSLSGS